MMEENDPTSRQTWVFRRKHWKLGEHSGNVRRPKYSYNFQNLCLKKANPKNVWKKGELFSKQQD